MVITERAMTKLKLTKIGNSVGVILPKEMLARLNVVQGDELIATEEQGGLRLSAYSPEVERQIDAGLDVMRRYRHTLKKLAE
jgi:putative addiction module antidote